MARAICKCCVFAGVGPVALAAPVFYWDGDDDEESATPLQDLTQADVADSLYRAGGKR